MWPFLIPAAIGALGSVVTSALSAREAAKNRDFQERMSDTAHQREIQDLTAAGLNPVLSAGHGASTPSGSVAPVADVGEGAGRGVASALAVKQQRAALDLIAAQTEQARSGAVQNLAGARKSQIEADATQAMTPFNLARQQGEISLVDARAAVARNDSARMQAQLPFVVEQVRAEIERLSSASAQARAQATLAKLSEPGAANSAAVAAALGELGPWGRILGEFLRGGASVTRDLAIGAKLIP